MQKQSKSKTRDKSNGKEANWKEASCKCSKAERRQRKLPQIEISECKSRATERKGLGKNKSEILMAMLAKGVYKEQNTCWWRVWDGNSWLAWREVWNSLNKIKEGARTSGVQKGQGLEEAGAEVGK